MRRERKHILDKIDKLECAMFCELERFGVSEIAENFTVEMSKLIDELAQTYRMSPSEYENMVFYYADMYK